MLLPPTDVLLQILSHIPRTDRRTLHSCLLTSRGLYALVAPELYHTIHLSSHNHLSPLFDSRPPAPAARGPLAKRRGIVGKVKRSRKAELLSDAVKVLQVDARTDGPFADIKAVPMLGVRTLVLDMRLTKVLDGEGRYNTWGNGMIREKGKGWENLAGVKPKTLVIKHLGFHESIDVPEALPESTKSDIERIIYVVNETAWDTDHFAKIYRGSNAIDSFGLHQWFDELSDRPLNCKALDIVFWTHGPGLLFRTPRNKYDSSRYGPGNRWISRFIEDFTETMPLSASLDINFVNVGALDAKRGTSLRGPDTQHLRQADPLVDFEGRTLTFRNSILREIIPDEGSMKEKSSAKAEKTIHTPSVWKWLEMLQEAGVDKWDIFKPEELAPWEEEDWRRFLVGPVENSDKWSE